MTTSAVATRVGMASQKENARSEPPPMRVNRCVHATSLSWNPASHQNTAGTLWLKIVYTTSPNPRLEIHEGADRWRKPRHCGSRADAILALLPSSQPDEEKEALKPYIERMLKPSQYSSFVALLNEEMVIGCAQVEISPPASLIRGLPTGAINICSKSATRHTPIVVRSLYHRANQWLGKFNVLSRTVELPAALSDLISERAKATFTDPQTQLIVAEPNTSSQ
jgi:hypothetical protein